MNHTTDTDTDGDRLRKLFDALKAKTGMGKAEFARVFKAPGGASQISQHISGNRPIGLDSMACYTNAFKCVVSDISPAMAAQIKRIAQAKAVSGPSESRFALEMVPLSQDALKLAHWFDGLPAGAAKAQALADCMRVVAGCLVEAGQSAAHGADAQAKTSDAPRPGAPVVRKMPVSKRIDQGER